LLVKKAKEGVKKWAGLFFWENCSSMQEFDLSTITGDKGIPFYY